jgi:hypothetical protein
MVFCNYCNNNTDQNYTCNVCKAKLKVGFKVTNQIRNLECYFKDCKKLLPYKKIVWRANSSYFHLDCYEKKVELGTVPAITKKEKNHQKKSNKEESKERKDNRDLFSWFKNKKEEKNAIDDEPKVDIMDSISGIDWPTADQIDKALSNLKEKSNRDEIHHLEVVENMMGLPLSFPGQFARVYKMHDNKNNQNVALRFFSKKKKGSMNRYRILHEYFEPYFQKDLLSFFINFDFIKDAVNISVDEEEHQFPIIKMGWIEGETLEEFLQKESNKIKINKIKINFKKIIDEMERHEIAHGDLHPKNMIVSKNKEIKLVDYDCTYLKEFEGKKMPELGDPDCQHPNRVNFKYDHTIDRFSAFVLYFALSILEDNPEFSGIRNGEFIFSRADYENPEKSETFKKISELESPEIQYFLKILKDICREEKPSIDPLSSIVENIPSIKEDNDKK